MENEETNPGSGEQAQGKERLKHRVLKAGESFGNYRVVRCVSAGLIANYYHMQHVRDLHDVTVGVFHPRTLKDPKFTKRLQALQKTIEVCDHEAIPKIRSVEEINDRHCLFLDMVKGRSLSHFFSEKGGSAERGIGVGDASGILAQLLGTLGYAHTMKVDHRDLDSDLIFVQDDGSVRLLGLGVKAAAGVELFESIVSASVSPLVSSKTSGRLNSFDMMSPEYRSGVSEDFRVDVYGAAVIGYWLLTGAKPAPGNPKPVSEKVDELGPQWDLFFEKALHVDRDERYASCKVALVALKETEREPESERAGLIQRQIDRIPVPKSILARGELAARVYRLSVIGLVGLTLTAIAASFLTVAFTEAKSYTRDVARLAEGSRAPDLRIRVQPSVARIQFVRFGDRFVADDGLLELRVQPGEYEVKISAPRHIDEVVRVEIGEGGTRELSIDLKPAWTDFRIVSEPGATVSVVDERNLEIELGVTNEKGIFYLKKGIFAGVYRIIVRKEGYGPGVLENQRLEFDKMTQVEIPLEALPSSLTVRSEPEGAVVKLNDAEVGETPLQLDSVKPGDAHLVSVHLEGYRPLGRRIEIRPGEDEAVDFGALTPLSGTLEFALSFQGVAPEKAEAMRNEATVRVDETEYPLGAAALRSIPEGRRTVRVLHPRYQSDEYEIDLQDRETERIEAIMRPRPAVVELALPGSLKPDIRIDGERREVEESGRVTVPADRVVEFELRLPNYLTMVRRFDLEPNERVVWEVEPVPIPGPTKGQTWTMPYLGLKFAWIPEGAFVMGSPPPEPGRLPNEGPRTDVRVPRGYWIGVYEVTQAQFRELMDSNPSEFKGARHPVDTVVWKEARTYCELLTDLERDAGRLPEGYEYRLPTEAEWEYAARAGTTTPFYFGSEADASVGAFRGVYPPGSDEGLRVSDHYGTLPVGSFEANPWGLHDVHGNVEEWTLDIYNGRLPGGDLTAPAHRSGEGRIAIRGGSWEDFAVRVRSAARDEQRPTTESNALGFRVVLAPEVDE